jgi:hypothetical protein
VPWSLPRPARNGLEVRPTAKGRLKLEAVSARASLMAT